MIMAKITLLLIAFLLAICAAKYEERRDFMARNDNLVGESRRRINHSQNGYRKYHNNWINWPRRVKSHNKRKISRQEDNNRKPRHSVKGKSEKIPPPLMNNNHMLRFDAHDAFFEPSLPIPLSPTMDQISKAALTYSKNRFDSLPRNFYRKDFAENEAVAESPFNPVLNGFNVGPIQGKPRPNQGELELVPQKIKNHINEAIKVTIEVEGIDVLEGKREEVSTKPTPKIKKVEVKPNNYDDIKEDDHRKIISLNHTSSPGEGFGDRIQDVNGFFHTSLKPTSTLKYLQEIQGDEYDKYLQTSKNPKVIKPTSERPISSDPPALIFAPTVTKTPDRLTSTAMLEDLPATEETPLPSYSPPPRVNSVKLLQKINEKRVRVVRRPKDAKRRLRQ